MPVSIGATQSAVRPRRHLHGVTRPGIAAVAARIQGRSVVAQALVVARSRHDQILLAVGERQHRQLGAWTYLSQDLLSSSAECSGELMERILEVTVGQRHGRPCHRQAVRLGADWHTHALDHIAAPHRSTDSTTSALPVGMRCRWRDIRPGLLHSSCAAARVGPKASRPCRVECRPAPPPANLRPDDRQVDPLAQGKIDTPCTSVAWTSTVSEYRRLPAPQHLDPLATQVPRKRVLSAARADDEDLHRRSISGCGARCPGGSASAARIVRQQPAT